MELRPRAEGDDPSIVRLHCLQEPDGGPLTLERFRQACAAEDECWVMAEGDEVLGTGSSQAAWWTGDPGIHSLEVRVYRRHQRQGIGTGLLEHLVSRLTAREATRLLAWVREDCEGGLSFAARHDFRETGPVFRDYRLFVPEATTAEGESPEERLRAAGLHIASLAELAPLEEPFLRALQGLWAGSDGPPDAGELAASHASWRREVLEGPGLSPETHWVVLDEGRPVGMTFLKRLSEHAAENDYTGVAATHQGRGVATALKLRAIDWARQHGVRWFYTSSKADNSRMIGINTRLGYRPGVRRVEVARDLSR